MAVRVKVRIGKAKRSSAAPVEAVALANSGFESSVPEVLLPRVLARLLGLWPPGRGARFDEVKSPLAVASLLAVPRAVRVSLEGARGSVLCDALVAEDEAEVVLNDQLVGALRIVLVDAGRGLYRVGTRGPLRRTENPQRW